jgi:hypothetical protein
MEKIKRLPSEFEQAVKNHGITFWYRTDCTLCGYACGFHFKNGLPFYDNGCHCSGNQGVMRPRTWDDVAESYNIQTHPDVIKRHNEFWHFKQ